MIDSPRKIIMIAVGLSLFLTIILLRSCQSQWLPTLICGSGTTEFSPYKKILPTQFTLISNINESKEHSLNLGRGTAMLIDGNEDTQAAPASRTLDYYFKLFNPYLIKSVRIVWRDYGINENYINQWSLEATEDGEDWEIIEEQLQSPQANETLIEKKFQAVGLRLKVESAKDWIGIYEVELVGKPL